MIELAIACQAVIALTVISVWTVRYNRATAWRGGTARSMPEEFKIYGLSDSVLVITRITKIMLATLLLAGIWMSPVASVAALGMAGLMSIAVIMHLKVRDELRKSLPAFAMLILCLIVVYEHGLPWMALAVTADG